MNAQNIVNTLLETLPGKSQAEVDQIMQTILGVVDQIVQRRPRGQGGNSAEEVPEFERLINPLLKDHGIRFDAHDPTLSQFGMPGMCDLEGVCIRTPYPINRNTYSSLRTMLSHELVHADQISRAMQTGSAAEMVGAAERRMMPKGRKGGVLDQKAYMTNPHEISAYARSHVDMQRQRRATQQQVLQGLRSGQGNRLKSVDTGAHRRFLKHAAGYAQDLPEK